MGGGKPEKRGITFSDFQKGGKKFRKVEWN